MPRSNAGGPQPGSGHPPGHEPARKAAQSLSARPTALSDTVQVSPAVEAVCKLSARGITISEIARRQGLCRDTVRSWQLKYRSLISQYIDALADPKQAFAHLRAPVLQGYETMLDPATTDRDPVLATMLKDTADRIWDKPRIISESYSQAAVHVTIQATGFAPPTPELRDSALYDIVTDAVDAVKGS